MNTELKILTTMGLVAFLAYCSLSPAMSKTPVYTRQLCQTIYPLLEADGKTWDQVVEIITTRCHTFPDRVRVNPLRYVQEIVVGGVSHYIWEVASLQNATITGFFTFNRINHIL